MKKMLQVVTLSVLAILSSSCRPYQKLACGGDPIPTNSHYNTGTGNYRYSFIDQLTSNNHYANVGSCSFTCDEGFVYNQGANQCVAVNTNQLTSGEAIFFSADDGTGAGYELWVKYPTGSPWRLTDINPNGNSYPYETTISNGRLFFTATDGTLDASNSEVYYLYTINPAEGIAATKVQDQSGNFILNPFGFKDISGSLYMDGTTNNIRGLYRVSVENGQVVLELAAEGIPQTELYELNGTIYYGNYLPSDGTSGVFGYNVSTKTSSFVKTPDNLNFVSSSSLAKFNNKIFFMGRVDTNFTNPASIYSISSSGQTQFVITPSVNIVGPIVLGGTLLFGAYDAGTTNLYRLSKGVSFSLDLVSKPENAPVDLFIYSNSVSEYSGKYYMYGSSVNSGGFIVSYNPQSNSIEGVLADAFMGPNTWMQTEFFIAGSKLYYSTSSSNNGLNTSKISYLDLSNSTFGDVNIGTNNFTLTSPFFTSQGMPYFNAYNPSTDLTMLCYFNESGDLVPIMNSGSSYLGKSILIP